jgi:hypothetical protein
LVSAKGIGSSSVGSIQQTPPFDGRLETHSAMLANPVERLTPLSSRMTTGASNVFEPRMTSLPARWTTSWSDAAPRFVRAPAMLFEPVPPASMPRIGRGAGGGSPPAVEPASISGAPALPPTVDVCGTEPTGSVTPAG